MEVASVYLLVNLFTAFVNYFFRFIYLSIECFPYLLICEFLPS